MNKIKKLREKANLTQVALAEIMEVEQSTVSMWETRGSLPISKNLPLLAKTLGCTIDELLTEQEGA